ncbi:DMT family transporter [Reinekea blandensis]|uniref:DMT family transporter n=1 Tax=Reinekea blandensis TaxID=374838 RepID=UPI0003265030|nr:DMT family transporter [Reinekea blandensis]
MNAILYAITVVIWGSTWLAIYFQVGEVPVSVSVMYRFALAAALMLPAMALLGKLQKTTRRDQGFMVLQGACLFSMNFLCFYSATQYISSGLVSVIFSLATLFNAVNNRVFFRERLPVSVFIAAGFGLSGLSLLFWPELTDNTNTQVVRGAALAALGTLFFSLGNMVSKRHSQKGLSPLTTNAYAMTYGAGLLVILLVIQRQPLVMSDSPVYWGALVYLSVFGSIVAFTTYLMLVARIGANRAAYATVMFPMIALLLSWWFEGYRFNAAAVLGMALTVTGNIVISQPRWLSRSVQRIYRSRSLRQPNNLPAQMYMTQTKIPNGK